MTKYLLALLIVISGEVMTKQSSRLAELEFLEFDSEITNIGSLCQVPFSEFF